MIRWRRRPGRPSESELAAFVDGRLPAERRAQVEEALSSSPKLQASVDAQQRVLSALDGAAGERAPTALRARLVLARPGDHEPARRRLGFLVTGAAVATAVAVGALVLGGGGLVSPTVVQASLLSTRVAQSPVAKPPGDRGPLPGVRAAGLTFPYWQDKFGYRSTGVRYDRLGSRTATTVFYARGASRVAYGIVSGPPLRLGAAAARSRWGGLVLRSLRTRGGAVVTWTRDGHTCVLTGAGTPVSTLVRLASSEA
jgi:hypothetical protein